MKIVGTITLSLMWMTASLRAHTVTVRDPNFTSIGGSISGVLDLNVLDGAPTNMTGPLGSAPWLAQANASGYLNLGIRPTVSLNSTTPGAAVIDYGLGASLGGLLGFEYPDAYIWQPLSGVSLLANTEYTLTADVTSTAHLSLSVLSARGVGIGLSSGANNSSYGTMLAETLTSSSSAVQLTLLGNNVDRLSLTFTTGANPTPGDLGIVLFAGRGIQPLQISLLDSYQFDNVSLQTASIAAAVPEPSTFGALISGVTLLGCFQRLRRPRSSGSAAFPTTSA